MVEIKFCGMMRAADAMHAAALGAQYVGIILVENGGPRTLTNDAAHKVFGRVPKGVRKVGVFGAEGETAASIAERAEVLELDVVQLHGDPDAETIAGVRERWGGEVWAVQRLAGTELPDDLGELFVAADAVVLDVHVSGKLGGTGVPLPWEDLRDQVAQLHRSSARLVIAGGLRPDNVGRAITALHPDIVDVSSGVEARIGVKDHDRMRAFRDAVYHAVAP
jgi:phosphoribosylanthranilate isomerase